MVGEHRARVKRSTARGFPYLTNWAMLMFQMVKHFEGVVDVLGGAKALKDSKLHSFLDFDRVIHAGIPIGAFQHIVNLIGGSEIAIAAAIGIARTTLNRRKATGRLGLEESERVVRLGLIVALGNEALGSARATGRWLVKPNRALGGRVPLELLQTDIGGREVEAVLGRALLGGFS